MPKPLPELFIVNILLSANKIQRRMKGISFVDFVENEEKYGFVVRELQEIGESARKLRDNPGPWTNVDVEWEKIIRFRNIVVHVYFASSPKMIFEVATNHAVRLEQDILNLLRTLPNKKDILQVVADMKKVYKEMRRKETVKYLEYVEYLTSIS